MVGEDAASARAGAPVPAIVRAKAQARFDRRIMVCDPRPAGTFTPDARYLLPAARTRSMRSSSAAWTATRTRGTHIVRQHWRKVFNIAYKFAGKHDEAEDLTQDVFLKIFKSLDTFDRRANFQTWLVSVSRNLCIDHYRSVRKERETIDRDVDAGELAPAAPTTSPIAALEQRDRVDAAAAGAASSCRRRCARRCCCATSRNCRTRRSPTGCTCRKAPSSRASTAAAPSWRGRFDAASDGHDAREPESQDEPDHRTTRRRRHRPRRRGAPDVPAAGRFRRRRRAADRRRRAQAC